jgi:hypothetical protein
VLLHQAHRSVFILTAHHSIGDGISSSYLVRDVLRALSGENVEVLPVIPSVEKMFGLPRNIPFEATSENQLATGAAGKPGVYQKDPRPQVRRLRLSKEFTNCLVERSRKEGTTVHGALSSALVLAGREVYREWKETLVRIYSPVDTRRLLGIVDNFTLSFTNGQVSVEPHGNTDFWELARFMKNSLSGLQTHEGALFPLELLTTAVKGLDLQSASRLFLHEFQAEAMLSNLGSVRYDTTFGKLKLEAIWGPSVLRGFENDQTIGVATANGALCLLHTTFNAQPPLLEVMEQVLTRSIYRKER